MAIVHWEVQGRQGSCEAAIGTNLMDLLHRENLPLDFPCGGNHSCGKCRVQIDGAVSPMTKKERKLLSDAPAPMRLACFTQILGDCRLRIESAGERAIATDYFANGAALDPLYPGEYGAAIDIGTTTIAAYLFARTDKDPLAVYGEMNEQGQYGADVLTRIAYAASHGVSLLQEAVCSQIGRMLQHLCAQAQITPAQLSGACVTGNTTMLHLATGLDPYSLSQAPFQPVSVFGETRHLPIPSFSHMRVYLPRCISAYVGADITCSILASDILRKEGNILMVDIGTNGEMALKCGDRLLCCATAAGPAFEGAGISCGSSASAGAISAVKLDGDGRFACQVIGAQPPASICGSGLIDAIACMLDAGTIEYRGRFKKGADNFLELAPHVRVTLPDVRQVQLAKGAIRAGIDTLLDAAGVDCSQLDQIVLCGGFGSYMNPISAERIGLIPEGTAQKAVAIGNAAGTGAGWMLQSQVQIEQAMQFVQKAEVIELSVSDFFKSRYIQAMNFPKPIA